MAESKKEIETLAWSDYLSDPWRQGKRLNPDFLESREISTLRDWYYLRVISLPFMVEEESPLTDGRYWQAEFVIEGLGKRASSASALLMGKQPELKVEKIFRPDNLFYVMEGRRFTKYKDPTQQEVFFSWNQPVLITRETIVQVGLFGHEIRIPVNGYLGVISDTEGRVLMTVDQEAMAETPNHAIVRLPIQASAGKVALMRAGKPQADKGLSELLKIYPRENSDIEELLAGAEFIVPVPPEDTNRDVKHNILLLMPPLAVGTPLHRKLVEDGTRKWLSPVQRAVINLLRLTNTHTITAVSLERDLRLLENFISNERPGLVE